METCEISIERINKEMVKEARKEFVRKTILAILWGMVGIMSFFAAASIVMMVINCFIL